MLVSSRCKIMTIAVARLLEHRKRSRQPDTQAKQRDPTRSALIFIVATPANPAPEDEWPRPESFA